MIAEKEIPAVVATLDDAAKPEEVAAEVPDTAPETDEKVKEEKGKIKVRSARVAKVSG